MKEEAGMKLWSPTRAFVGLAVAGLVALLGTTADAGNNIYKNYHGLAYSFDPGAAPTGPDGDGAGPTLNPGGSGQLLYAGIYDVRDNDGVQINNIQILNQNTNDKDGHRECQLADFMKGVDGEECYNQHGGILAKVRFRAYKQSEEVLDFVIALSCGEVWAGNVSLDGTTPVVKSKFPIVVDAEGGKVTTAPAFDPNNGGAPQPFLGVGQPGVESDADQQRGYIEVFALESLWCEPDGAPGTQDAGIPGAGVLNLDGGTWTRRGDHTGTNAMSGEVFLVRPAIGVSYGYQMDAITRFAQYGESSLVDQSVSLFSAEDPNTEDCEVFVDGDRYTETQCRSAVSLAMSKSMLFGQYDIEQITAGDTKMVVTVTGKSTYCAGFGVSIPPFECNAYQDATFDDKGLYWGVQGGEEIRCEVYDRQENFFIPGPTAGCGYISPCEEPPNETDPCFLPYEQTIFGFYGVHELGTGTDQQVLTGLLPAGGSGWIELDLTENYDGNLIHKEAFDTLYGVDNMTTLGMEVNGYLGMPATGLVLQTYENGSAGGTYGNAIPMTSNQQLLFAGEQS